MGWLVSDPFDFEIDWAPFRNDESLAWEQAEAIACLYPDTIDEIPPCMPSPLGQGVSINCFIDADHAGNSVKKQPHAVVMIFINMASITWFAEYCRDIHIWFRLFASHTACEMVD